MFQRLKADRTITKDLRNAARDGVISKRQVLAVADKVQARGDHRGAVELRAWMQGYCPHSRHRLP